VILEPEPRHDDEPASTAGRPLMSRPRAIVVHASLVLFALAILARAVQVQLVDSRRWAQAAEKQQVKESAVSPPRGQILDANGEVLVESRELMRLKFTPRNIRPYRAKNAKKSDKKINARVVVRQGLKALGVHDTLIRRVLDTTRAWVELPGAYLPSDVERFAGVPGVTRERMLQRMIVAESPGLRGVLGTVNASDRAVGGIEQELDSLLQGVGGSNSLVNDGRGNLIETPALDGVAARPGHSVVLTINRSLQALAERELAEGITRTGASGGDVVIVDPRDGAVLAIAGVRNRRPSVTATAVAEPYEPGSVMKPFIVSRALDLDRVQADDRINTEGGKWLVARRVITDEHKADFMTVYDVIRHSSNIGAAKIAQTLSPKEEYEALRDFGFGTPTGVPYPAESRGRLPTKWGSQTRESIAMGYEISATPIQIAAAYVALANDGELLQPALVREVRDPDGKPIFSHARTVVRRVIEPATARLMRTMLASVVDSGTAMAADMATYDVAGKSGTARRAQGGRYDGKSYNSTFAGMFPVQAPQYVLVVRLVDPQGKYYGGTVAGRVVNAILQGALATRDASLDRRALAAVAKPLPVKPGKPLTATAIASAMRDTARFDSLRAPAPRPAPAIAPPTRVAIDLTRASPAGRRARLGESVDAPSGTNGKRAAMREVPSVYGLDTRQAVRTLHAAGFHVALTTGNASRTRPAAGALARGGSVVVLESPR